MQQSEAGTLMAIETVCMQPAEVDRTAGNTKNIALPPTRGMLTDAVHVMLVLHAALTGNEAVLGKVGVTHHR